MAKWIIWVISLVLEGIAIYVVIWGVKYEVRHKASKGVVLITIGFGLGLIGALLFAKVLPLF